MINSAYMLNKIIPNSVLKIKKGFYHGEYSINHAKEYAEKVTAIVENI